MREKEPEPLEYTSTRTDKATELYLVSFGGGKDEENPHAIWGGPSLVYNMEEMLFASLKLSVASGKATELNRKYKTDGFYVTTMYAGRKLKLVERMVRFVEKKERVDKGNGRDI